MPPGAARLPPLPDPSARPSGAAQPPRGSGGGAAPAAAERAERAVDAALARPFAAVLRDFPRFRATVDGLGPARADRLRDMWGSADAPRLRPLLLRLARQGQFRAAARRTARGLLDPNEQLRRFGDGAGRAYRARARPKAFIPDVAEIGRLDSCVRRGLGKLRGGIDRSSPERSVSGENVDFRGTLHITPGLRTGKLGGNRGAVTTGLPPAVGREGLGHWYQSSTYEDDFQTGDDDEFEAILVRHLDVVNEQLHRQEAWRREERARMQRRNEEAQAQFAVTERATMERHMAPETLDSPLPPLCLDAMCLSQLRTAVRC